VIHGDGRKGTEVPPRGQEKDSFLGGAGKK